MEIFHQWPGEHFRITSTSVLLQKIAEINHLFYYSTSCQPLYVLSEACGEV